MTHARTGAMTANPTGVEVALTEQLEHQWRVAGKRMPWWIPWIFVAGLCVSIVGLIPSINASWEQGSPTASLFVYALFTLFFGSAVFLQLFGHFMLRPRIVPYFARKLGELGGDTMVAFRRGRSLYREIVALERIAGMLGVTPLSVFGFAYDYYEQEVRWHPAAEGLKTIDALRQNLDERLRAALDVPADLDALASVMRVAVEKGVDFSLVLRLHAKDSVQMVCTREVRQGSFW
jgi:hypothetical protein